MRFLFLLTALITGAALAETAPITGGLAWDYGAADEARIDGYRLYVDGMLTHEIADPSAREVSFADAGVAAGTYVFTLTAYNTVDESAPSDQLGATVVDGAPPAPTLLRIEVTIE